jgi:two-component sensor histidine kinase
LIHAQTAFTLTLSEANETVLLTVRDNSKSVPVQRDSAAMEPGGLGLKIVNLLSLDWGVDVEDGSKTTWASFTKGLMRECR